MHAVAAEPWPIPEITYNFRWIFFYAWNQPGTLTLIEGEATDIADNCWCWKLINRLAVASMACLYPSTYSCPTETAPPLIWFSAQDINILTHAKHCNMSEDVFSKFCAHMCGYWPKETKENKHCNRTVNAIDEVQIPNTYHYQGDQSRCNAHRTTADYLEHDKPTKSTNSLLGPYQYKVGLQKIWGRGKRISSILVPNILQECDQCDNALKCMVRCIESHP